MIEVREITIGDSKHQQFSLLCDSYIPSGFVLMECRNSDMKYEGCEFFIDITTDMIKRDGDKVHFAPMGMEKSELKQFIDFLQARYDELPDEDIIPNDQNL